MVRNGWMGLINTFRTLVCWMTGETTTSVFGVVLRCVWRKFDGFPMTYTWPGEKMEDVNYWETPNAFLGHISPEMLYSHCWDMLEEGVVAVAVVLWRLDSDSPRWTSRYVTKPGQDKFIKEFSHISIFSSNKFTIFTLDWGVLNILIGCIEGVLGGCFDKQRTFFFDFPEKHNEMFCCYYSPIEFSSTKLIRSFSRSVTL